MFRKFRPRKVVTILKNQSVFKRLISVVTICNRLQMENLLLYLIGFKSLTANIITAFVIIRILIFKFPMQEYPIESK